METNLSIWGSTLVLGWSPLSGGSGFMLGESVVDKGSKGNNSLLT